MICKSKREFERNIGIQSKSNQKIFWSHVRSKLKTKTGVVPLLQDEKDETSTKFDDKEYCTAEVVLNKILKLNVNKSCGPHKIYSQILIELVDLVSKPLALLLNKTMVEGGIPQDWKMTYVSPIFKKEARNKAENYRPLTLTSIVCKLMESFVKNSIMTHMRTENILSSKQYGFINGRSTIT